MSQRTYEPSAAHLTIIPDLRYPPEPVSGRVTPFVDLSSCNMLESFTLGLRGSLLRGSHGLLAASYTIQSLPQSPSRLRELCVVLRFTLMDQRFDLRKWISENAEPIRVLEESLMTLMDRCSPPLEYLILRPKLFGNMAGGARDELDMTPFVREMFPRLEETGRMRIRPLFPVLWETLYVRICQYAILKQLNYLQSGWVLAPNRSVRIPATYMTKHHV